MESGLLHSKLQVPQEARERRVGDPPVPECMQLHLLVVPVLQGKELNAADPQQGGGMRYECQPRLAATSDTMVRIWLTVCTTLAWRMGSMRTTRS